jgi:hypothetical protein
VVLVRQVCAFAVCWRGVAHGAGECGEESSAASSHDGMLRREFDPRTAMA